MKAVLRKVWVRDEVLRSWLEEDVGIVDLTTFLAGFKGGEAVADLITREACIVSCSEEAGRMYELGGASRVEILKHSGEAAEPGDVILQAYGDPYSLHTVWRNAQKLVAICSGVSTSVKALVNAVRDEGSEAAVSVTRKSPPGLRSVYLKATFAGGGVPHRMGLYDSVMIFGNHVNVLGGWGELPEVISEIKRKFPFKPVGVEASSMEEASLAVKAGADIVQLERFSPSEVGEVVKALRSINPRVKISVAGGVTKENIKAYVRAGVDFIVTTAPFHAPPVDLTTKIRLINP